MFPADDADITVYTVEDERPAVPTPVPFDSRSPSGFLKVVQIKFPLFEMYSCPSIPMSEIMSRRFGLLERYDGAGVRFQTVV